MEKKLVEEIREMIREVEKEWEEIGLTEQEKRELIESSSSKVLLIYSSLLQQAKEKKEALKKELKQLEQHLSSLFSLLGLNKEGFYLFLNIFFFKVEKK